MSYQIYITDQGKVKIKMENVDSQSHLEFISAIENIKTFKGLIIRRMDNIYFPIEKLPEIEHSIKKLNEESNDHFQSQRNYFFIKLTTALALHRLPNNTYPFYQQVAAYDDNSSQMTNGK